MNVDEPALSATRLTFRFGPVTALDAIDVEVPVGRFVALLGRNGAGKTTLFSLVTGLYSSRDGEIAIGGHSLRRQPTEALESLGVVFQRSTVDTDLSVRQNLDYAACLYGLSRREAAERIHAALDRHELAPMARRRVATLSGGQRRRVELARALLHRPTVLLLDEPTVGLDMQSRRDFLSHVRTLCQDQGLGVLWATHLLDEIGGDDRLILLERGRVQAQGELAAVLEERGVDDLSALFEAVASQSEARSGDTPVRDRSAA